MHPVTTAVLIVFFVALAGVIIVALIKHRSLSGYEALGPDARALAETLKGEFFRDGGDLVVSGHWGTLPTVIRFSHDENTPGMNIVMRAQANFTLSVVPKGARATEGRVLVQSNDEMFDARFQTRTDHPTQARMLLGSRKMVQQLSKLVCSSRTFFTITTGSLELSELLIPEHNPGNHITEHLKSLGRLAEEVAAMPGAEKIKVERIKRESNKVVRVALAVGIVAAILAVVGAMEAPPPVRAREEGAIVVEGIPPLDMPQLKGVERPRRNPDGSPQPGVARFRLAGVEDYDAVAVAWLRSNGVAASGRIEADFSGTGSVRDAGYVLIDLETGRRRVAMLASGSNRYDATFPDVALAARVRRAVAGNIQWVGAGPQNPDGDGLLIVRQANDRASGLMLFLQGNQVVSGVPQDWQQVIVE